jgi:hypothetical protein
MPEGRQMSDFVIERSMIYSKCNEGNLAERRGANGSDVRNA